MNIKVGYYIYVKGYGKIPFKILSIWKQNRNNEYIYEVGLHGDDQPPYLRLHIDDIVGYAALPYPKKEK